MYVQDYISILLNKYPETSVELFVANLVEQGVEKKRYAIRRKSLNIFLRIELYRFLIESISQKAILVFIRDEEAINYYKRNTKLAPKVTEFSHFMKIMRKYCQLKWNLSITCTVQHFFSFLFTCWQEYIFVQHFGKAM